MSWPDIVVDADMLHLVVYHLVWGIYMLAGEVAMLESVVGPVCRSRVLSLH